MGKVPNLFAFMGYSANGLGSYLQFSQAQAKGAFNAKEHEAISLAVYHENGCAYCQAVHTYLGKLNGFTEEDTIALHAGTHSDKKLNVLTRLAADIQNTHGKPSQELLAAFFDLGYNEGALVDLIALIADKAFTNYLHNITQIPVDFPAVASIEETVA